MENIIKELMQIESNADTLITSARDEMKHLDKYMHEKEVEIKESIYNQTTEHINRLQMEANRESQMKIIEIKQNSDVMIAELEKLFEQNRSQWEADVFNQIIGK